MTDCAELNGDCASIADEANYNSMLNSKPLPVLADRGQHVDGERRAVLRPVVSQGPCPDREALGA